MDATTHRPTPQPMKGRLWASAAMASLALGLAGCGGGGGAGGNTASPSPAPAPTPSAPTYNMATSLSTLYTNGIGTAANPHRLSAVVDGTRYYMFVVQDPVQTTAFPFEPTRNVPAVLQKWTLTTSPTAGANDVAQAGAIYLETVNPFQPIGWFQPYYPLTQRFMKAAPATNPVALPAAGQTGQVQPFIIQSYYASLDPATYSGSQRTDWAVDPGPTAGTAYLCLRNPADAAGSGYCYLFDQQGAFRGLSVTLTIPTAGNQTRSVPFTTY